MQQGSWPGLPRLRVVRGPATAQADPKRDLDTALFLTWQSTPEGQEKQKHLSRLCATNDNLVKMWVRRLVANTSVFCEFDEALQAGRLGLLRALGKWDPARGQFSTIAFFWVRYEVQQALCRQAPVCRPREAGVPYQTHRKVEAFTAVHGRDPQPDEVGATAEEWSRWQAAAIHFVPLTEGDEATHHETSDTLVDQARDLAILAPLAKALSDDDRTCLAGKRPKGWGKIRAEERRDELLARLRAQIETGRERGANERHENITLRIIK